MKGIKTYYFEDDGIIPNNRLPVILYKNVIDLPDTTEWLENNFKINNWSNNWRDTILPYDHFHSNTHEVIGLCFGEVKLKVGGLNGEIIMLTAGDVMIIPAGVGHYSVSEHSDYQFVGGYPDGSDWDLKTGREEEERINVLSNISKVKIPKTDPLHGISGYLFEVWK